MRLHAALLVYQGRRTSAKPQSRNAVELTVTVVTGDAKAGRTEAADNKSIVIILYLLLTASIRPRSV